MPEAADPGAVAQRLVERLSERKPGVLHGVVGTGLEVAPGLNVQIEQPVAGHGVEQVIEEADAGLPGARARSVQVEAELDVGFAGGPVDLRGAGHARRSIDSA